MLKTTIPVLLGSLAVAIATPSGAQEHQQASAPAVGEWELTYETPRGRTTAKVTITQAGEAFAGTAELRRGSVPLTDVTVRDDQIAFSMQVGRGDRTFMLQFHGTIDGDSASGTMKGPMGGGQGIPWTARKIST